MPPHNPSFSSAPKASRRCYLRHVQFGGSLIHWYGGKTIATGCTFRASSAATDGGVVVFNSGGDAEFYDCTFEGNSADNGGVFHVSGTASLLVSGGRVGSSSANIGGVLVLSGGSAFFAGVRFNGPCTAITSGGILSQAGGALELTDCYLSNANAPNGGAFSYVAGTALIRRSTIASCTGTFGAGIYATAPDLVVEDSIVRDCVGDGPGSGLDLPGETSGATVLRTAFVRCNGGPAINVGGTLTLAGGSSIRACTNAVYAAGGLLVAGGGRALVVDSSISDCHAESGQSVVQNGVQAGGAAVSAGGDLTMHNVTISGCTSIDGAAAIHARQGAAMRGALLTIVTDCTGTAGVPMLLGDGNGSLLLRALSFEAADGCDVPVATLAAAGALVAAADLPSCAAPGVCGVEAACELAPSIVAPPSTTSASLLAVPTCNCDLPNTPNPSEPSTALAPYTTGCVTPRRGDRLIVLATGEASQLVVRLQRTAEGDANATRALQIALGGTAEAAASWRVNAIDLPSWLRFEQLNGTIRASEDFAELRVTLSTRGLPGSLEPYRASVDVAVTAQQDTTFRLEVSFFVTAVDGRPCPAATWLVDGACLRCPPEFLCGADTTVPTATLLPGFYRNDFDSTTAFSCQHESSCGISCPAGINCTGDTTRATVTLDHGYWRYSSDTMDVRECQRKGAWSPCIGGQVAGSGGDGYCATGHRGPRVSQYL